MPAPRHLPRLVPAAAAIGLALVAVPTAWAVADNTGTNLADSASQQVVRLTYVPRSFRADDVAPTGTSSGDTLQIGFTLTGKSTGTADYACTAVDSIYLCSGIIRLAGGDIYVATGPLDDTQPAAIEGGTKAYQGISGQFTKKTNADGSGSYVLTFRK